MIKQKKYNKIKLEKKKRGKKEEKKKIKEKEKRRKKEIGFFTPVEEITFAKKFWFFGQAWEDFLGAK